MSSEISLVVRAVRALKMTTVKLRRAEFCWAFVKAGWLCFLLALIGLPLSRADEFYVVRHHWHSGIVISRAAIPPGAWPQGVVTQDFAGCRCLELGWGDRAFYTAPKPTVLMALSAALIPGASVLHVAGFKELPTKTRQWEEIVTVSCTHDEFTALCRSLGQSFTRDAAGRTEKLGPGLYGFKSRFYAAQGRYWIGNTCNSWTLREARHGGLPTRLGVAGTLTSGAVTAQVRRLLAERECRESTRRRVAQD